MITYLIAAAQAATAPLPPPEQPLLRRELSCKLYSEEGQLHEFSATLEDLNRYSRSLKIDSESSSIPSVRTPVPVGGGAALPNSAFYNFSRSGAKYLYQFTFPTGPDWGNGFALVSIQREGGPSTYFATGICRVQSKRASS